MSGKKMSSSIAATGSTYSYVVSLSSRSKASKRFFRFTKGRFLPICGSPTLHLGCFINFNVTRLQTGIKRFVL